MLHILVSLVLFVTCSNAALKQWGLQYFGTCASSNNNNQRICNAKAESQTVYSYIDPTDGVDFGIQTDPVGSVSILYIKMLRNQNGQGFIASGNATFGSDQNVHSTVYFMYNNYDEAYVNDPENTDYYINAAYLNVTGGTGAFNMAFGLITFVATNDRGDGSYNPYVFANLVIPN